MPKGIVEDVLIKAREFVFPVDFIVLETQAVVDIKGHIPVILGRPFLATSNALINCRNGLMRLSFGNMTTEINIFHVENQPDNLSDQPKGINFIQEIAEERTHPTMITEDPLALCLAHFG